MDGKTAQSCLMTPVLACIVFGVLLGDSEACAGKLVNKGTTLWSTPSC